MAYVHEYDHDTRCEVQLSVTPGGAGLRLDLFLARRYPRISRSMIQRRLRNGEISVNHHRAAASYRVKPGDAIAGWLPAPKRHALVPCHRSLFIIFADNDLAIVAKPAGMTAHPVHGQLFYSAANVLRSHLGAGEYHIVHRLDRDTSGVLVAARTVGAARHLSRQFAERMVVKRYLALVEGVPAEDEMRLEYALEQEALTELRVLERFSRYALVELRPHTGRKHQLRRHAARAGFPILGDQAYGGSAVIGRPALHALSISFRHPSTERLLTARAAPPEDFVGWLQNLRRRGQP